jgi:hypothetical protein
MPLVSRWPPAARRHDQRVGLAAVDDHGLGAVDPVALAVDAGDGLDVGQVVARVLLAQRAGQFQPPCATSSSR